MVDSLIDRLVRREAAAAFLSDVAVARQAADRLRRYLAESDATEVAARRRAKDFERFGFCRAGRPGRVPTSAPGLGGPAQDVSGSTPRRAGA